MLTENLSLRCKPVSMICEITTRLEPVLVQCATYTSVMWKTEAFSAQTLRMNFTVKEETSCVWQEDF